MIFSIYYVQLYEGISCRCGRKQWNSRLQDFKRFHETSRTSEDFKIFRDYLSIRETMEIAWKLCNIQKKLSITQKIAKDFLFFLNFFPWCLWLKYSTIKINSFIQKHSNTIRLAHKFWEFFFWFNNNFIFQQRYVTSINKIISIVFDNLRPSFWQ